MPYVTAGDDTQLYYKEWGRGRPVVLLHGWPLNADSWDDHALALADAGLSRDRLRPARVWQVLTTLERLRLRHADRRPALRVQALPGHREASLIGFSMGGGEVARYMTKYNGAGVVQAGLIASIVPYKLKTDDNPHGTELKALDETTAAIKKDRPKFFAEFFKKFYGVDTAEQPVSDEVLQWSLAHDHAGRAQTDAGLHRLDLQDGFPARPRLIQSADAHHSWHGGPERVDRCVREARGARHQELEAHRIRRLAAWLAGHRQTTHHRSPAGVSERL